jgi:hypothetical protein
MALLYRSQALGKDAIAAALCMMLKKISWFSARVQQSNHEERWSYLGPHCALVSSVAEDGASREASYRRSNGVCFYRPS